MAMRRASVGHTMTSLETVAKIRGFSGDGNPLDKSEAHSSGCHLGAAGLLESLLE